MEVNIWKRKQFLDVFLSGTVVHPVIILEELFNKFLEQLFAVACSWLVGSDKA